MTRPVEVTLREGSAAPVDTVRARLADPGHAIRRTLHRGRRLELPQRRARGIAAVGHPGGRVTPAAR